MKLYQIAAGIGAAALILGAGVPGQARAEEFKSEYSISVIGLPVGKIGFSTKVDKGMYQIKGAMRASGVAKLFTSTTGSLSAKGKYKNGKIAANSFDLRYKEGKKAKRTTMSYSGNRVSKVSNKPALKKKGKWVDVQEAHLNNALDPMIAALVPAANLRAVCKNTLRIFDGAMRADFPMRYVRTIPFSTKGYKGDAVTCRARFKPISGYNKNKKDIRWMRDNGYADISFAPVGSTGLYAPVAAKVKTKIGMATIRANRFETLTK